MIKQIIVLLLITFIFAQEICPQKLILECEKDAELGNYLFNSAYQACEKAAQEKGADQTADINCVKYLLSSRKDCWPCICSIAKKEGWKIKGCVFIASIMEIVENLQKE